MQQESNENKRTSRERHDEWETALEGDDLVLPEEEVSLEELGEEELSSPDETVDGELIHTQDSDGSTSDPYRAQQQGLVYNPPSDPPVIPSDDLQNADIAAGFEGSVEEGGIEAHDLPDRVDDNDLDIERDLLEAIEINSETTTLEDVYVRVRNGVVFLAGTVPTEDDRAHVDHVVRSHDAVREVRNGLKVET